MKLSISTRLLFLGRLPYRCGNNQDVIETEHLVLDVRPRRDRERAVCQRQDGYDPQLSGMVVERNTREAWRTSARCAWIHGYSSLVNSDATKSTSLHD